MSETKKPSRFDVWLHRFTMAMVFVAVIGIAVKAEDTPGAGWFVAGILVALIMQRNPSA